MIDQNIETKDLETHRVIETLRLCRLVQMTKLRLTCYNRFHDDVFDLIEEFVYITSLFLENL
jgi:hypothetical protein